jgi:trehalose 6-phosphate phosphatase
VPPETRDELRRLHARYALVACISGRARDDARRVVGVPGLTYVGNHGLELHPEADRWARRLEQLLAETAWPRAENKRVSASFHYRGAADEASARSSLAEVAARFEAAGFVARFGRKVLEVLPPLDADKGTAVSRLLVEHGLDHALYAGDDTTDLDGFAALETLVLGVRVAVASAEAPPALLEAADLVVSGPEELLELLRRL